MNEKKIEILDVTLRDGEQTRGVAFTVQEKLNIAKFLLLNLKVDRIEIASARVSSGELRSVQSIIDWSRTEGMQSKIEILGFTDNTRSADWAKQSGVETMNLLTKGSFRHLKYQLKKTPEEHITDIQETVEYATQQNIRCNVYLEDWSNGFLHSPDYVLQMVDALSQMPVQRIFLADTLGVLSPAETKQAISTLTTKYPNMHFEFHGHNDYDLSVANCLEAVQAGAKGLHASINGLGERAGNSPLEAVITALHDKSDYRTGVVEKEITKSSRLVEVFSGKRISANRPIVGEDVYTQTAGIHADGDKKANLYANPILPERFGRKRSYALGKLAGKASISENLKQLGMSLSEELEKKILQKVIQMGDNGFTVTPEDLPFLIADLSGEKYDIVCKIESCVVNSGKGVIPSASLVLQFRQETYKEVGMGDGGYDAFMNALQKISQKAGFVVANLEDYEVRIPPGGKASALVETIITWHSDQKIGQDNTFRTIGVDPDQIVAAIIATEKMLNLVLR
ncbi:MAG: alpha-isopropylmalate synthase regulatory domain-containing protein [Spirochaetota bacterium]